MALEFRLDVTEPGKVYDTVIIGGGPAGLSAAIYAARAKLSTVVLDKNPLAGAMGMTSHIANYPGVEETVSGPDLLARFRRQAESFGAEIVRTQVVGVDFTRDPKEVVTADGTYKGRTVIIATGSMGRKPSIEGEAEYLGKGVSYCAACDAAFFEGKDVAVIGSSDEATDELGVIAKFARRIYYIPRGKLSDEQLERVKQLENVETRPDHRVLRILGDQTVTGVEVAGPGGDEESLPVSGVFVYLHGNKPVVDFLGRAVETTEDGCIKVNKEDASTSVEGVFAVGDVTCKEIRQAVIAAAEGCVAGLAADKFIHNRKRARTQWS